MYGRVWLIGCYWDILASDLERIGKETLRDRVGRVVAVRDLRDFPRRIQARGDVDVGVVRQRLRQWRTILRLLATQEYDSFFLFFLHMMRWRTTRLLFHLDGVADVRVDVLSCCGCRRRLRTGEVGMRGTEVSLGGTKAGCVLADNEHLQEGQQAILCAKDRRAGGILKGRTNGRLVVHTVRWMVGGGEKGWSDARQQRGVG